MSVSTTRLPAACILAAAACAPPGDRKPRLETNREWTEPAVEDSGGGRYVLNSSSRAFLEVNSVDGAVANASLLFWGNQAVARGAGGEYFVADEEAHEVLIFDAELNSTWLSCPRGASPRSSSGSIRRTRRRSRRSPAPDRRSAPSISTR